MRNLHFASSQKQSVFAYPCGMGASYRDEARGRIMKAMGNRSNASDQSLTPSEKQVIDDFYLWVDSVDHKEWTSDIVNGAFTYFNVNTGNNVILIAWCGYGDYATTFLTD